MMIHRCKKFSPKIYSIVFYTFVVVSICAMSAFQCGEGVEILLENDRDIGSNNAFFKFNDLTDSSGNGHHLQDFGVSFAQNRALVANSAYNFSTNYLRATTLEEFNFTDELTISAWIRSTNAGSDQKVVGKVNSTFNGGYLLAIKGNRVYVEIWDSVGTHIYYSDGSQPLNSNTWYHIALTRKAGGYLRSYVDGNLDKEIAATANPIGEVTDRYLVFGAQPWNPSQAAYRFQGEIDDVRIYDRELSGAEILALSALPAD